MSLYESLPVYKKALDLAKYFDDIVSHFAKRHKYTIGAKLFNLSCDILLLIAMANKKIERKARLEEALIKLEAIKVYLHLCKEVKAFHSFNSFEVSTKLVIEISKQCEGWLKCQNSSSGKP
jgi:aspartate carbamoyltransferase regulatory subunit